MRGRPAVAALRELEKEAEYLETFSEQGSTNALAVARKIRAALGALAAAPGDAEVERVAAAMHETYQAHCNHPERASFAEMPKFRRDLVLDMARAALAAMRAAG